MGVVPPAPGYLAGLRELCHANGALLMFDEVMTGFRVAWGGAQILYNINPDLTCLGKVIGGGLPVGASGGSKKLMEMISPSGPVYQAGTLSGNPLAMSAGIETLDILHDSDCYQVLEQRSAALEAGLLKAAGARKVPVAINRVGSMLTVFFVKEAGQKVTNFSEATACDRDRFKAFFHGMLANGVYLPPSQFEAWFVSTAHGEAEIQHTIEAADQALASVVA
jgi:glutamate-1-semialdehyde 2,1-aminomutase